MKPRAAWLRTKAFADWDDLERRLEGYYLDRGSGSNQWVFRGVPNVSYGLLNSLERCSKKTTSSGQIFTDGRAAPVDPIARVQRLFVE